MKALFSGTFDPVTIGHMDVLRRASLLFDEVHAVIFVNAEKKCMFTQEQRLELLTVACPNLPNVKVSLSHGMPALYCLEHGIGAIVRGIRSASDFDYEYALDSINRSLNPALETVFLPSRPELAHISSSAAREMLRYGHGEEQYLPPEVLATLRRF